MSKAGIKSKRKMLTHVAAKATETEKADETTERSLTGKRKKKKKSAANISR